MDSIAPLGPRSPDARPATYQLAEVHPRGALREVTLPAAFAAAALDRFLRWQHARPEIIEGPAPIPDADAAVGEGDWGVVLPHEQAWRLFTPVRPVVAFRRGGQMLVCLIYPRGTVLVTRADARLLLSALESVKPEELDADGRPLPWVPADVPTEGLAAALRRDDDVEVVAAAEALPRVAPERAPEAEAPPISTEAIRAEAERIRERLGVPPFELVIRRGRVEQRGFVTGRVWFTPAFVPLRVLLTTCPNADLAEILATLVHELAHPLSETRAHGRAFKETLVRVAGALWGDPYFAEARARVGADFHGVDLWIATGIRAALNERPPPVARSGDDGITAATVNRIRAMRARAADQRGRWEGITATALANDLVVTCGLESYEVRLDARIHDQMVDRWVPVEKRKAWKRSLAFAVADYCDVFALSLSREGRMHYFGTYADVVAAEYLFSVSEARISRECGAWIDAWKRRRVVRPNGGETRSEQISFCDSAVMAFGHKLERLRAEQKARAAAAPDSAESRGYRLMADGQRRAKAFARAEHERRGQGWSAGASKTVRHNAAGAAAGRALEPVRGLDASGAAPRRLGPPNAK